MNYETFTLSSSTQRRLKKAGVVAVYFFGSRASGNYFPFSDLDVGIVVEEKRLTAGNVNKLYNIVHDILSSGIPDEPALTDQFVNSPKLDIAFLQKANPVLAMKAIREGKILFESDSKLRAEFEETIIKKYDDYSTLQREYEEANIRTFENPEGK